MILQILKSIEDLKLEFNPRIDLHNLIFGNSTFHSSEIQIWVFIAAIVVSFIAAFFLGKISNKKSKMHFNSIANAIKKINDGEFDATLLAELEKNITPEVAIIKEEINKLNSLLTDFTDEIKIASNSINNFNFSLNLNSTKFKGVFESSIKSISDAANSNKENLNAYANATDSILLGDKFGHELKNDGNYSELFKNLSTLKEQINALREDTEKLNSSNKLKLSNQYKGALDSISQNIYKYSSNKESELQQTANHIKSISKGEFTISKSSGISIEIQELSQQLNLFDSFINSALQNKETSLSNLNGEFKVLANQIASKIDEQNNDIRIVKDSLEKLSINVESKFEVDDINNQSLRDSLSNLIDFHHNLLNNLALISDSIEEFNEINIELNSKDEISNYIISIAEKINSINNTTKTKIYELADILSINKNNDFITTQTKVLDNLKDSHQEFDKLIKLMETDTDSALQMALNSSNEQILKIGRTLSEYSKALYLSNEIADNIESGNLNFEITYENLSGERREIVDKLAQSINHLSQRLSKIIKFLEDISLGNDLESINSSEFGGQLSKFPDTVDKVRNTLNRLSTELGKLSAATKSGDLDFRIDESQFSNNWKLIIADINNSFDSFKQPITKMNSSLLKLSAGELTPEVQDNYSGYFETSRQSLNSLIKAISEMQREVITVTEEQKKGDVEARCDCTHFKGIYFDIIDGINQALERIANPIIEGISIINEFAQGNLEQEMRVLPGKQIILTEAINSIRANILKLLEDTNMLVEATIAGDLETRINVDSHLGNYQQLVQGINRMLDAIVTPFNEAGNTLATMATGDLSSRMHAEYTGYYRRLAEWINSVGESLHSAILQVSQTAASVASLSAEISENTDTMAEGAHEQTAQAEEVASAVEVLTKTITENADSANQTAEVAQKNREIAQESGEVVEQTVNKMRDIADVVYKSAENIEKLGQSSQQIGEIISVINDIADQTNLLALNAAIEAARAGEQGRGFAVVADEVRKLAERTTDATKKIATMIKGIQNETSEAVQVMKKGNEEVQDGISLADKAGSALQEIVNSAKIILDMNNQIARVSEDQSSTSEQISKNVLEISEVTGQSARQVENIAKSAESLAKLTEDLQSLMSQFHLERNVYTTPEKHAINSKRDRYHLPPIND